MKKFSLIATLLSAVLLLQKCTKDTVSASAQSSTLLFAVINDTTWNAATVNTSLTYNSATKTKVLACTAIGANKEVNFSVTQINNAINTTGFPLATFNADSLKNGIQYNTFSFLTNGSGGYTQQGIVAGGSGTVIVSAIDSVKKVITGTFSFLAKQNNYDANGNIVSVTINGIQSGSFNNMPYTFTSK
ncbi:MAG: hypothetical protein ACHQIM_11155 [Sphingobacteriales bacterium]